MVRLWRCQPSIAHLSRCHGSTGSQYWLALGGCEPNCLSESSLLTISILGFSSLLCTLRIVRDHFDFDPHVIFSQACDTDTSPDRLVVGHVLLEVPHHGGQSLVVDWDVVRVDTEDLGPTLATSVLEAPLDIGEGQIDLGVDLLLDTPLGCQPPAAGQQSLPAIRERHANSDLGLHTRSCRRCGQPGCRRRAGASRRRRPRRRST